MTTYEYGDARYGIRYEEILQGKLTFNSSYNALVAKGYRLYGAGNVAYILIPSSEGGHDGIVLTSGSYQDFYGDHTRNGLKGGAIYEAGFYKNANVVNYGDGTYDIEDFEYSANLIASIPLGGMTIDKFLAALATQGNTYSPLNLFRELLKTDNWISGDNQGESTVVDGFDGNDEFYISTSAQFARGGAGNDLFQGTPTGAAILDGGLGDDTFDGSSGSSDRSKQYLWVGGKGGNLYRGPDLNTIVVIDQKMSGQSPDIIAYADLVLARQNQKTGYVVIKTSNPDVSQLDLRFVDQPLLDATGKKVEESGYFSVLYKGVEQVKINPMSGGWDLDGFIAAKDTYENNIRSAIAVASMEQLIVPSNYSATALQEIKNEYGLSTISDKASVDLRGQTLLDKSSYVSIADRFYLTEIKQNPATGQLELIFNQTVGSIGTTTIFELDSSGKAIKYAYFGTLKKDGNKVITSIANTGDKKYLAVLQSGWTNTSGTQLEGQGQYGSSGVQSYQFTFGKDTVKPTVTSVTTNGTNEITVIFSENIEFANTSASTQIGYLSRKQSPTSLADLAHTFTANDGIIKGDTLTLKIDNTLDGDLYFLPLQIKDPTGNYYSGSWTKDAKLLSFEDPVAAANRVKINRNEDNSFIIPLSVFWRNAANRNLSDGSSITFSWKQDGSTFTSISDSFYAFQDYGQYIYALKDSSSAFQVTIGDFVAEGIHKLSSVTIYHGNGGEDRYETPEAISQLLKDWDLPAGSLDIEVIGEAVSFVPTLNSLSLNQTSINIGDLGSSVFGTIKWNIQSSNPFYAAATRLDHITLEYSSSQGYGQTFSLYPSSWDSELVSGSTDAVFRIDSGELYSGLKPGTYQLTGATAEWSSPTYLRQEYSAAQLIDLGLPASLTLEGSRTESNPQLRRLLEFSIDNPIVNLEGSDTYRFVQAKVEVDNFNPQRQSYLEERISLSFTNSDFQSAVQASGNYGSTLYREWDSYLNSNLYPTSYAFDSSSGKATIGFEGRISVSKNQYSGDYTLEGVSLQGAYYRNNGGSATAYLSEEEPLGLNKWKIGISGGLQKSSESVISLTDVDPILTQVPAYDTNPYRVTLNPSKSESQVGLNVYLSHTSPSKTDSKESNLLNTFYKDLLFPDLAENSVLFGWFGLVSPSGFQTKTIPIALSDEVDPERHWRDTYPSVHKYAPIVTFNQRDEPGDWRLTSLYLTSPSTGSLFQENLSNLITAYTPDYRDGSASAISTEAIASRLGVEPSRLVVTVENSLFDKESLDRQFQVNPQITDLKISFSEGSIDAGDRQKLQLAIDSDYAFGDASKNQFYAIRLLLGHDEEHVFALQSSDIYINATSRNVVSEVETSAGRYRTVFDLDFVLPESLYSGQYTLRKAYLVRDYVASSLLLNPQFERFDQVNEGLNGAEIISLTDGRYASSTVSGFDIVPRVSTVDRDFLQYQLSRFDSNQSVDDLAFTINGKQVDDSFLNPRPIDYRIRFIDNNYSVLSGSTARARFEISSDFEDKYRSYFSSRAAWEVCNDTCLSLTFTNQTTGESTVQQARYVGASSSLGQSVYEIILDSSISSGIHRITSLGTTFYFDSGIEADSLRDGISTAEAVLLDKIFGEGSTVFIANDDRALPSISLFSLGFSASPLEKQSNAPEVDLQDNSLLFTLPKVSIASDLKAPIGGSIGIPINIDDATDLQSIDLIFSYDPAIFTIPSNAEIVSASDLTRDWSFAVNASAPGQIRISGFGTTPLEGGEGGLINLNLKINSGVDAGSTLLDLVSVRLNEGKINADIVDGTVVLRENIAPIVNATLSGLTINRESAFMYTLPANLFSDPDSTLIFSAATATGASLPSWLSFNPATRTLSGTPTAGGTINLNLSASDELGSVSTPLSIKVREVQQLSSSTPTIRYQRNKDVTLPINYSTTDGSSSTGLAFKVHFNSSLFSFDPINGVSNKLASAGLFEVGAVQQDTGNSDNDPTTDQYIPISIASFAGQLPSGSKLADLTFRTADKAIDPLTGLRDASINFTEAEAAQGYGFSATSASLRPLLFSLDVDRDGKVTALGDGLMVIRYLFGNAFAGDALINKAISPDSPLLGGKSYSTMTATEKAGVASLVATNIQQGIDSKILDIDKDGKITALGDGLMVIRRLFGTAFDGAALTSKAISPESLYFGPPADFAAVAANIDALNPQRL